jgi:predicted component of type VI protein secretion system
MPPQLVALTEGQDILLDKPILLLGRHQECDIQLNSRKISRRHCCIAQVNDHLVVRDLCSTNGIRINGTRVMEGNLKSGDQLTVGNFSYRVEWDQGPGGQGASARAPAPAPPPEPRAKEHIPTEDALESCEMPIPLADPDHPSRPGRRLPLKPQPRNPAPAGDQPPSAILPEQLGLAPLSDIFPKSNPPPSPSSG